MDTLSEMRQYHQWYTSHKVWQYFLQLYYLQITTTFIKPLSFYLFQRNIQSQKIFIPCYVSIYKHMIRIHWEAYYLWWSHHHSLLTFTISVKILFWDLTQLPTDKTQVVGREKNWRIKYIQTLYEYFQIRDTAYHSIQRCSKKTLPSF